jgi:hypothetical protein
MKILLNTSLTFLLLLFIGCYNNQINEPIKKQNTTPNWMTNPTENGSILGAVGCAKQHYRGINAQVKLAVARAIEQIAQQKSTTVSTSMLNKKSSSGSNISKRSDSVAFHKSTNITLSTIKKAEYWKSKYEVCVWVIEK